MKYVDGASIAPDKALFFSTLTYRYWYFSYFFTKTYVVVLIRSASWGTSNEYPQCLFLWRNKKNIYKPTPYYLDLYWRQSSIQISAFTVSFQNHLTKQIPINIEGSQIVKLHWLIKVFTLTYTLKTPFLVMLILVELASRKHAHIILTPLNPTFIQ